MLCVLFTFFASPKSNPITTPGSDRALSVKWWKCWRPLMRRRASDRHQPSRPSSPPTFLSSPLSLPSLSLSFSSSSPPGSTLSLSLSLGFLLIFVYCIVVGRRWALSILRDYPGIFVTTVLNWNLVFFNISCIMLKSSLNECLKYILYFLDVQVQGEEMGF